MQPEARARRRPKLGRTLPRVVRARVESGDASQTATGRRRTHLSDSSEARAETRASSFARARAPLYKEAQRATAALIQSNRRPSGRLIRPRPIINGRAHVVASGAESSRAKRLRDAAAAQLGSAHLQTIYALKRGEVLLRSRMKMAAAAAAAAVAAQMDADALGGGRRRRCVARPLGIDI